MTGRWRVCWLCILPSWLCHDDVIIIRVWHVGRVVWYSGRVSPSGRRRRVWRVARVCARGQCPGRRVTAREDVSDVWFRRGFQQWLRLVLLYIVVWSKHNFDNFHFWAKSNTPLNHQLWYQLLGNSGTPCADRGCTDSCSEKGKAHWHNILRGSAKPLTSTGESHCIRYRDTWRRRITSASLTAAAMAARLLPLQLSLSLYSHSRFLSQFSLHSLHLCSQI